MDSTNNQPVTASRVPPARTFRSLVWAIGVSSAPYSRPPPPELPADLPSLSALSRVVECLRYFLLKLERALAPAGELRALTKMAARWVFVLGMLLFCCGLVLSLLAGVLAVAEVAAGRLEAVLWHIFMAVVLALATVVVGAMLWVALIRIAQGRH